jgi:hypothetical protein
MTSPLADHVERIRIPPSWFEHGESLLVAARILANELNVRPPERTDAWRVRDLGAVRGAMTLLGAGVKCLLKGLAVSRGLLTLVDNKVEFATELRGWRRHDLAGMARSLRLELSATEADLVERAQVFLIWAGRYPTSLRSETAFAASADGALRFSMADVATADGIAARIRILTSDRA